MMIQDLEDGTTNAEKILLMLSQIAKKRTSFEKGAWEEVRELMPRREGTRGIQYEALEYLFKHLYEKVSEEQLREHFLEVKGHLQQKGDPVKSSINLAIKELQRLNDKTFEIIKIQDVSPVGKVRRFVQLNFVGYNSVIDYNQYQVYLEDVMTDENQPVLRTIFNLPPNMKPVIFPGVKEQWLGQIRSHALVNSSEFLDTHHPKTSYYFIPESQSNRNFMLVYEDETAELPFLAFVSNAGTVGSLEESEYMVYRGEEKMPKLRFLHQIWVNQKQMALEAGEASALLAEAATIVDRIENSIPGINKHTLYCGMLAAKSQEKWNQFIMTQS